MIANSDNKLLRKRPNRLLTARRNYFVVGGGMGSNQPRQFVQSPIVPIDSGMGGAQNPNQQYNTQSTSNLNIDQGQGGGGNSMGLAGAIGSVGMQAASDIAGMINNIQGNDIKADADNRIKSVQNNQMSSIQGADSYDRLFADYASSNPLEHITAKQMGASNTGQMLGNAFVAGNKGFASGAGLGPLGAGIAATMSTITSLIGSAARNRNARKAASRVNQFIDYTNAYNDRMFASRASNIADTQMNDLLTNYAAFGGPLEFSKGGSIHIKPENRGKFTETKRRTGKTTEELTHSSNPLTRKRAIFAQNAKKWHHAFGGELNTQGGDFTNGLMYIDEGGSHESNPYEGVQLGVDPEGTPNLVEEGETVFNDYVFSKRLSVPKAVRNKYRMRDKKHMSFADMSKRLAKESEERPNDPISQRGLEAMLGDLAISQEGLKASQQERQYKNGGKLFADGGVKKTNAINRYFEYGTGKPLDYTDEINDKGQSWLDLNPGYSFVDKKGVVRDPIDIDGVSTTYTDYYLRKNNPAKDRYYIMGDDGKYSEVAGDNPYLDIMNRGKYSETKRNANDLGGNDLYYDLTQEEPGHKPLPTWMRYAPTVGLGIASITDALGLTNKPDYGNADALLEASRGAGTYQPVRFKPIGNYLTYRPFDRNYYINKMNAEAGASRRAILNTASGNRATAMAGILAADNNYLNQIGNLARQGEEYNLAQRQQVEDFNRSTNITNSQGFLQADMANQKALMNARELALKGTMSAMDMRERAKLMSDQAKSANISGLFTSLGDIGRENMAWNWRNFGIDTGSFGNIGKRQQKLLGAKGGKIKRKKGLTI